jgi:hypothetical protein
VPQPNGRASNRRAGHRTTDGEQELFTVKQFAEACGLPQPVVAQLVPRTWTEDGGMYTQAQLELAIQTAIDLRRRNSGSSGD